MPITIGPRGGVDCRLEVLQHMRTEDESPAATAYAWLLKLCEGDSICFDLRAPWLVTYGIGSGVVATDGAIMAVIAEEDAAGHVESAPAADSKRPNVVPLLDKYLGDAEPYQAPLAIRPLVSPCTACPDEDCDPRVDGDACIRDGICWAWSRSPLPLPGNPGLSISNRYARLLAEIDAQIELPTTKPTPESRIPCRFSGQMAGVRIRGLLMSLND